MYHKSKSIGRAEIRADSVLVPVDNEEVVRSPAKAQSRLADPGKGMEAAGVGAMDKRSTRRLAD